MIDFKNKSFFKLEPDDKYAVTIRDLLVEGEKVLATYKSMRDGVVFTDRRLIAVNVQGITSKKRDFFLAALQERRFLFR